MREIKINKLTSNQSKSIIFIDFTYLDDNSTDTKKLQETALIDYLPLIVDKQVSFDGEDTFLLNNIVRWNYRDDVTEIYVPDQEGNYLFVEVSVKKLSSLLSAYQRLRARTSGGVFTGIIYFENLN